MAQTSKNYQSHLFFIEQAKNREVPEWFLHDLTREEAEEILQNSVGNVLMRKHSAFSQTGKYVVSFRKKSQNGASFRHYVVLNTPDGFLMDIDNQGNRPVSCLSEVMELFVTLAGTGAKAVSFEASDQDYLKPCDSPPLETTERYDPKNFGNSLSHSESNSTRNSYVNTPTIGEMNTNVPRLNNKSKSHPTHNYVNRPILMANSPAVTANSPKTMANPPPAMADRDINYVNGDQLNHHDYMNTQRFSDPYRK